MSSKDEDLIHDIAAAHHIAVDEAALKKAEQYIEAEEGPTNRLTGHLGRFVVVVAVIMSFFHLYAAYAIVPTQQLRMVHVGFVLFLSYLLFPFSRGYRHRVMWWDWIGAAVSLVVIGYGIFGGDDFTDRSTIPTNLDMVFGVILTLLVLEAARRGTGWIMPFVCVLFVVYAMLGPYLGEPWTHRGYDISRLVGHMYMTLEGIFGVPVDVSSSLIILFTIYGAFLQMSGAGKFFIDFSFAAMGGKSTGAGRTIVLSSFLLGGPSGSGVATTVTLGTVAYPMLAKAGYGKDAAGGLLAAGGLGAIISPPVLGAAAFLIAEFLKISYLDVILMATIPTLLYYFALLLMVEIDARKFGMPNVVIDKAATMWELTKHYGFHFLSLVAIIVFMLLGFSPVAAVFWATAVAFVMSALHPDCALMSWRQMVLYCIVVVAACLIYSAVNGRFHPDALTWALPAGALALVAAAIIRPGWRLWPEKLVKALEYGSVSVLNVAATCAAAGIIVGVVTLTGLGLKFSSIVLQYADSLTRGTLDALAVVGVAQTPALLHDVKLLYTASFTSLIVWIVGLAVPVTASYIICAVIAAPALILLGVPDFAAHMFIFYYAVLSEVSPPTALSPFAAAAITGGDPYKTTLQSWKYTMPAFLVPFMFVLDPAGLGLLLMGSFKNLATASWLDIATVSITAMIGIAALAGGMQGWLFKRTTSFERWLLIIAGLALVYPKAIFDYIGVALMVVVIVMQKARKEVAHAAA
ncbi:MAG: TRAP transporter fused permease subunit [Betaproteobacteria bacterium]|nr:TRAP transporter fused permease subunit [Betaproteobacteria bacterium]MBI2291213.1 TRAP transporter fused permease subunit [Betaproteobacteria bacterium]MBI3057590.1 TRAP transporter fused permease subunit [Betaproteobacteria bacterium]